MKSCILALAFFIAAGGVSPSSAQNRGRFGWLEKVRVAPPAAVLNAKLDTGADYSSLNASRLEEFERAGKRWIRFVVTGRNGQAVTFERPIVRVAQIKTQGAKPQKRPVVKLGICLGTVYMETDVNLVDRSQYTQQMLIGRNYLSGNAVIDPSSSYTHEPECKEAPPS